MNEINKSGSFNEVEFIEEIIEPIIEELPIEIIDIPEPTEEMVDDEFVDIEESGNLFDILEYYKENNIKFLQDSIEYYEGKLQKNEMRLENGISSNIAMINIYFLINDSNRDENGEFIKLFFNDKDKNNVHTTAAYNKLLERIIDSVKSLVASQQRLEDIKKSTINLVKNFTLENLNITPIVHTFLERTGKFIEEVYDECIKQSIYKTTNKEAFQLDKLRNDYEYKLSQKTEEFLNITENEVTLISGVELKRDMDLIYCQCGNKFQGRPVIFRKFPEENRYPGMKLELGFNFCTECKKYAMLPMTVLEELETVNIEFNGPMTEVRPINELCTKCPKIFLNNNEVVVDYTVAIDEELERDAFQFYIDEKIRMRGPDSLSNYDIPYADEYRKAEDELIMAIEMHESSERKDELSNKLNEVAQKVMEELDLPSSDLYQRIGRSIEEGKSPHEYIIKLLGKLGYEHRGKFKGAFKEIENLDEDLFKHVFMKYPKVAECELLLPIRNFAVKDDLELLRKARIKRQINELNDEDFDNCIYNFKLHNSLADTQKEEITELKILRFRLKRLVRLCENENILMQYKMDDLNSEFKYIIKKVDLEPVDLQSIGHIQAFKGILSKYEKESEIKINAVLNGVELRPLTVEVGQIDEIYNYTNLNVLNDGKTFKDYCIENKQFIFDRINEKYEGIELDLEESLDGVEEFETRI